MLGSIDMKSTCLQPNLNKALNQVSRLAPARSELPILSNFLVKATKGTLAFYATNLQLSICSRIGAEVEKEGEITAPAAPVQNYVSALTPDKINLEVVQNKLKVSSKTSQAAFVTMEAVDFPSFPRKAKEPLFIFKVQELSRCIHKVCFAAAADDSRPVLTGILVKVADSQATLVATDGFRLSEVKGTTVRSAKDEKPLVIPAAAFLEVEKLLGGSGEEEAAVYLSEDKNQLIFDLVSVQLATRLIESEFPDYEKILPTEFTLKASLDKEEFLRAVRTAAIFSQRDGQTVHLTFEDKSLTVEAQSAEIGEGREKIPASIEGDGLKIAFNAVFLKEGLEAVNDQEIIFEAKDSLSPIKLSSADQKAGSLDAGFFHIIMPIRIEEQQQTA